jgi:hypothetical protein
VVDVRGSKLRGVGQVEYFSAELDPVSLGDVEGSLQAHIQIELAGSAQNSYTAIAEAGAVADRRSIR